jgi:predicted aspartyl protease
VTRFVLAAVATLTILSPSLVLAQIYRYTDRTGTPHYVDGLDSVPQEYRSSAAAVGLYNAPRSSTPEPAMPVKSAAAEPATPKGGTAIKYTPGQPIMVDVKINGSTSAKLLLDTGADGTMINPRVLVAAGASLSRPVATSRVQGVAGSDHVNLVFIDSLEVGEARVGRMRVASYDIPGAGDGLLGRDFLDRFTVNIDSTNGVVTLSPK